MSVRLLLMDSSGLKKSMRTLCKAAELLPIAISEAQSPPAATCGNINEVPPPIVAVGAGVVKVAEGKVVEGNVVDGNMIAGVIPAMAKPLLMVAGTGETVKG